MYLHVLPCRVHALCWCAAFANAEPQVAIDYFLRAGNPTATAVYNLKWLEMQQLNHPPPNMHTTKPVMSIGVLAARTGTSVSTIRYYEDEGLLPEAQRRPSGHRVYGEETVEALLVVKALRSYEVPVDRIRALLQGARSSGDAVDEIELLQELHVRLESIRLDIAQLTHLEGLLTTVVGTCASVCASGPSSCCTMLADLPRALSQVPGDVSQAA